VDDVSPLYRVENQHDGTHLSLRWKGQVRYTVPRDKDGQQACWKVFRPGMLGVPLKAMAKLPRLLHVRSCAEGPQFQSIRAAVGPEAGLSGCRGGSEGVWSKSTVLLLDKTNKKPLCIVKVGASDTVDGLLQNEAQWLGKLRQQSELVPHLPELIAHRSGNQLCFLAQSVVFGDLDFSLGEAHFKFLRKLYDFSSRSIEYRDSSLYRTLSMRMAGLKGSLSEAWTARLETAMRKIEEGLSGAPQVFVTAHHDFTPWNVALKGETAFVFDWELAADEQLPLFDPLHFTLMPLGLWNRSTDKIIEKMHRTIRLYQQRFGEEFSYSAETQALAYFVNLSTLYLWSRQSLQHPLLLSSARLIDRLCSE